MWTYLSLAALLVGFVACELKTPCPGLFEYEKQEKGHYEATLILQSDYKLHGVWARLFFDNPVKDLKVLDEKLGEVKTMPDDAKTFLIKNRDLLLEKKEPVKVRFSVGYEGSSPPALIGYRLNGRDVCPEGQD